MSFSEFYQCGGLFMHLISLAAIGATVSIVRRVKASRAALEGGEHGQRPLDGSATPWLVAAALLIGVAGTLLGFSEVGYALATVPPEQTVAALIRGSTIAIIPLTWASLICTPLVLAHAALRPFETRLQLMARKLAR